jgi:glycosyltransferase involved in cell wall biosynthesis
MKRKILFVSHDASRTGAPIVLLNLIKAFNATGNFEIAIFLKYGGPLQKDFEALAPTFLPPKSSRFSALKKRILRRLKSSIPYQLPQELTKRSFDVVYLNTVASLDIAPLMKCRFRCTILAHIHEMDFSINYYYSDFVRAENLNTVDHFIAVSEITKTTLVQTFNIDLNKTSVVHECIEMDKVSKPLATLQEIRNELKISSHLVVGGCGLTSWRKGIDLFVALALEFQHRKFAEKIKFVWVGEVSYEFECQFNYQKDRLGLGDSILLLGVKKNPENYFQLFDVFALTSREDPFPLVALEAAALRKPIVCFERSGGIAEVAEGINGIINVPYGDVGQMADTIVDLMLDREKREMLGERAFEFVQQFDVKIQSKKVLTIINSFK